MKNFNLGLTALFLGVFFYSFPLQTRADDVQHKEELKFNFGSAEITPEAKATLAKIAQAIAQKSDEKIRIEGFTDSQGSREANDRLAEERAEAVEKIFTENGVKDSQISVAALGDAKPVAPNSTADGRADNRRVELYVSG